MIRGNPFAAGSVDPYYTCPLSAVPIPRSGSNSRSPLNRLWIGDMARQATVSRNISLGLAPRPRTCEPALWTFRRAVWSPFPFQRDHPFPSRASTTLTLSLPPLEYDRTVEVLLSVAEAVEYAHRAGVAHGDIKPANVLFTGDPAVRGVAKVGDWGLAKELLEYSQSTEGLSPAYAAPEQFEGGSRDVVGPQLTDIYQLGALAYRTLTGRPPFEGTPFEIMNRVQSERPTPPTEVAPSLPESVDEVVLTAMAKEPADRYETMTDFRRPLERL
jgi:serine/threonine protein kinase